jgi:hypothetical protein
MPSMKSIAWTVGLSLLTIVGYERYRARQGG